MGTRSDYYIGKGAKAEWLGSAAFDGYPGPKNIRALLATTEQEFRDAVASIVAQSYGTTPDMGWPWPWEDSHLTDYAYTWDDGTVWISRFGSQWIAVRDIDASARTEDGMEDGYNAARDRLFGEDNDPPEMGPDAFPNMEDRQNVTYGERSGALFLSTRTED